MLTRIIPVHGLKAGVVPDEVRVFAIAPGEGETGPYPNVFRPANDPTPVIGVHLHGFYVL